jgi:hypothetical protein
MTMRALLAAIIIGIAAGPLGAEDAKTVVPTPHMIPPHATGVRYLTPYHAPRYAYGWFGAHPRESWYRHFGYYRDYTQWKRK